MIRHRSSWDKRNKRIDLDPIPQYPIPEDLINVLKTNIQPYPGISKTSEEWIKSLKTLSRIKYVSEINGLTTFKLLLYLEEYYSKKSPDLIIQTKISRSRRILNHFVMEIPDYLNRVMALDIVEVTDHSNLRKHELQVVSVDMNQNTITLSSDYGFADVHRATSEYILRFQFSNWPIRACHYAISLVKECDWLLILYPRPNLRCNQPTEVLTWFDINIRKNPEQIQAVQRILGRTAYPSPYLLFGPPGTGKTATIVEAISQIVENLGKRVLVCTPSNAAADEITKRLIRNIDQKWICRLNSPFKKRRDIDRNIHSCSYQDLTEYLFNEKKVFIMTLVTSIKLVRTNLFYNYFHYIFIDEAGQATVPETLIPLGLTNKSTGCFDKLNTQIVMSGDPKQLGPVVMTKIGQHLLGESMLERLMNRVNLYQRDVEGRYDPNYITKLLKNFRNNVSILQIPSQMFYDNDLVCSGGKEIFRAEGWHELPNKQFPIIFHAVHGLEKRSQQSLSVCNPCEVGVVVKYVRKLMGNILGGRKVKEQDIGIVSPFRFQGEIISKALERNGWHNISVGTVEIFQGQEKSIIIVSTVRSNLFQHDEKFHIGFLSNEKRFNVTITRAKALLIVVGNPAILQIDHCWLTLIKYCQKNRACVGHTFTLSELSEDEMKNLLKKKPIIAELQTTKMEKEADSNAKSSTDNVATLAQNFKQYLRFDESLA